jgi:hypothetical protein
MAKIEYCLVKTRREDEKLALNEITFIEQLGRKLYFHTIDNNKCFEMYEKISYALPFLDSSFIVAGRVAINHYMIKSVAVDGKVRFCNGTCYLLSKKQIAQFRNLYGEMSKKL